MVQMSRAWWIVTICLFVAAAFVGGWFGAQSWTPVPPAWATNIVTDKLPGAILTVAGVVIGARLGLTTWWDKRKLSYELFKDQQLSRIETLRALLSAVTETAGSATYAYQQKVQLHVSGTKVDPSVGKDMMARYQATVAKMNERFGASVELAVKYGTLPKPYVEQIAPLDQVLARIRQNVGAMISGAREDHAREFEMNSLLSQLQGFVAKVLESEQELLAGAKLGDDLAPHVFRPTPGIFAQAEGLTKWWNRPPPTAEEPKEVEG